MPPEKQQSKSFFVCVKERQSKSDTAIYVVPKSY
jgi:hypothetical protein